MSRIKGAHIVLTGAAGDLGRLLAQEFCHLGAASLALLDVNANRLNSLKKELSASETEINTYVCDLSKPDQIRNTAQQIQSDFGIPHILIHNAGLLVNKPFWECGADTLEKIITVNSTALFWLTKAFLPQMLSANEGHIVTIASAAGLAASTGLASYPASKFAAVGFNETLRQELKQFGSAIRTTVVCPFYISTQMVPGVRSRIPFLLPVLKPQQVSQNILKAIQKNKKQVLMPRLLYTIPLLRLLPVSAFDFILRILGINQAAKTIQRESDKAAVD